MPNKQDKIFYPHWAGISKQRITELLSDTLPTPISIDDPRLTDEFCQHLVDAWEVPAEGLTRPSLFEGEDNISEQWEIIIAEKFGVNVSDLNN